MNPRSEWFGLIRIRSGLRTWFRIGSDWYLGINRIDFWSFFIKHDTKRFSDWFRMIRIGSDTGIGMNRNSSDWLGMNFNPILSLGWYMKFNVHSYSYDLVVKFNILMYIKIENITNIYIKHNWILHFSNTEKTKCNKCHLYSFLIEVLSNFRLLTFLHVGEVLLRQF